MPVGVWRYTTSLRQCVSFQTLALLDRFKTKLTQAIEETPENELSEPDVDNDEGW